ncbi:MAG: T9SS type A sorting domain-containing protein [Flavobacteriales bacterium]|jgi:hypothetical protein|nr:T9SS type A sorting domain-containing protein [Flavobacteriales bacterium]
MKQILLAVALITTASVSWSQITITSADIGQAGDSMIVGNESPSSTMNVGGTGSQTWDFTFQVDDYNTLVFKDPSNTASGSSFPNADIAIERQSDTLFFKKNSTEFSLDGLSGDVSGLTGVPLALALNIANDVTQIEFSSTFGEDFVDQAEIDTIVDCDDINAGTYCSQARIKRRYLVTSEVDAYGPLETSGGDYSSTIRQYYLEQTIDSVWANLPVFGGPMNFIQDIDSTSHIYRWFANGEKWPVLTVYADDEGGDIVTAEFQIDNLLGYVATKINPACMGDCNGAATVEGLGADPPYTYAWPASANNQTTASASGLCAGTYMVTVNDNDTDSYEIEVILTDPMPLSITGSIQGVISGNDGAIDITASGGSGTYTYDWSGPNGYTASSQDVSGLEEGEYTVVVTDENGCDTSRLFLIETNGINDLETTRVHVFPNPANNEVVIESNITLQSLQIMDLLGNVVSNQPLDGTKVELNTTDLNSGLYMLRITTNSGSQLKKITIQH